MPYGPSGFVPKQCPHCKVNLVGDEIHAKDCPERLGFVDSMETRPTDMKRSIHQSHRGEGRNFID